MFTDWSDNDSRKIVVYNYYGDAVYFDGKLKKYFHIDSQACVGWAELCNLLGIEFELRSFKWEDFPGQNKDSQAVYSPPEHIRVLEEHLGKLSKERKKNNLAALEAEVKRLKEELANGT